MGHNGAAGVIVIACMAAGAPADASPSVQDYEHAIGLRSAWSQLTQNVVEPAQWIEGTHRFVYRKTVPGGFQFVVMDADSRQSAPAFDHDRLAAALSKVAGVTYTGLHLPFTEPSATMHIVGDGRVLKASIEAEMDEIGWECSLADYVCAREPDHEGHQPRAFETIRDLKIPADNSPKKSPDGHWAAYVQNWNIAVRPAAGGETTLLSTDGSQGEFYDPESIVWAPDSKKLAAYRVRPGYRREVTRVASSPPDQLQPKVLVQVYPKPGDAVDIDRPVIFNAERKLEINVPHDLFPNPFTMSPLVWRKDSAAVTFEYDQRGHQRYSLIEANADNGAARTIAEDRTKTFINVERRFAHDVGGTGREIIWMSERDGWNHLYLYDGRTGRVRNQITKGDWVVREVVKVDDERRQIWFAAGGMRQGEDPYFQHYYRVNFDGSHLTPVTTENAYHDVAFSSDMAYYVDTYSRIDLPPVSELHRVSDGQLVTVVERGDISRLVAAGFKPPEVFVAKGRDGKTDIWGIIVKPEQFDPGRKYPVIENIYAGPHSSFVPKTFWPFGPHAGGDKVLGMQSLADMGFIVVQIDGMGTLNRSKAFHDVAWKNLGDAGFPDRILWHKAAAEKFPFYDISRVGIYGGSAGGQDSLSALEFHPEFYKVAVAYAGCYDNRMDKIDWNEQWMGWPLDETYSRSSGVDNAGRMTGHILMVVGELDYNVDPSSTLQVVDAMIKARKDFDLLVVPNGGHSIFRSTGDVGYGLRRQYDFFVRHLLGESTPDWNSL